MEKEHYPNACIVCSKTANLKRCSRCQMLSYCSSLHQKEHWPKHKDLCGIISLMMKERGVSHIFENLRGTDVDTMLKERNKMLNEAEMRVCRSFEKNDSFLFQYPRTCYVCQESRQTLLKTCPGCPCASFCKEHPNSPIHDKDCAKLRESFEAETWLSTCFTIKRHLLETTHRNVLKVLKPSDRITSMREFILKIRSSFKHPLTISNCKELHVSEFFSTFLTVFNALQELEFSSSTLTIHLLNVVDGCDAGEILFHLMPKLKELIILVDNPLYTTNANYTQCKLCPECRRKGKKMFFGFLSNPYGKKSGDHEEPDFLVYTNISVTEDFVSDVMRAHFLLSRWSTTRNYTLIVTTMTETEQNKLKKIVTSVLGNIEMFFDGLNPFSSFLCYRNYWDGRFGMGNQYAIILNSKLHLKQKLTNETKISTKSSAVFYASVCHVCGSSNAPVTCKRCKMIFYCGKHHQEEHQAQHKDLCKAILGMLIESGTPNLFDKLKTEDSDLWLRTKLNLMSKARSILGRKLLDFEKQMFLFPKTCFVCHDSDLSVLKICKCGVNLCNIHYDDQNHKKLCNDLFLDLKLTINGRSEIPKTTVRTLNPDANRTMPISMEACLDSFMNFEKKISNFANPNLEKILLSDFLTRPFTLHWCLEKLNYKNKFSLVVHVIGATNSEVSAQNYWKMVLYRFEKLKTLKIIFIGPEISKNSSLICGLKFPRSSLVGKNLQVESHALRYEEYFQSESFIQPNVIIGFNLHFHESDLEIFNNCTWKETVLSLKQIDAPFILTAGSETRAQKDHKRLCHLLGKSVDFLCCEQNPFAGLIPERDFETEKLLFSNQYLIIYNKLYEGKLQKLDNFEDIFQSMTVSETESKEENKLTTELKFKDLSHLKFINEGYKMLTESYIT